MMISVQIVSAAIDQLELQNTLLSICYAWTFAYIGFPRLAEISAWKVDLRVQRKWTSAYRKNIQAWTSAYISMDLRVHLYKEARGSRRYYRKRYERRSRGCGNVHKET